MGRTEVEDALLELDTLTKDESLMAVVRTLEVTHIAGAAVAQIKGL
jgi:hypothetical protein